MLDDNSIMLDSMTCLESHRALQRAWRQEITQRVEQLIDSDEHLGVQSGILFAANVNADSDRVKTREMFEPQGLSRAMP